VPTTFPPGFGFQRASSVGSFPDHPHAAECGESWRLWDLCVMDVQGGGFRMWITLIVMSRGRRRERMLWFAAGAQMGSDDRGLNTPPRLDLSFAAQHTRLQKLESTFFSDTCLELQRVFASGAVHHYHREQHPRSWTVLPPRQPPAGWDFHQQRHVPINGTTTTSGAGNPGGKYSLRYLRGFIEHPQYQKQRTTGDPDSGFTTLQPTIRTTCSTPNAGWSSHVYPAREQSAGSPIIHSCCATPIGTGTSPYHA